MPPHRAEVSVPSRVPITAKPATRCPYCGSRALTRKGTRKKKLEIVQLWRCTSCKRVFTPAPKELRGKTYPMRLILDGLTFYNLGYSLAQATAKLKTKYGHRIPTSTLSAWLHEYQELTTYARLRADGKKLYPPGRIVRSVKLYHRQVYEYAFHRAKLDLLRRDSEHRRFSGVADFLEAVPGTCPHRLFTASERASQYAPAFADVARLTVNTRENFATRMAALIVPTVGDNRLRHETLQRFMLANDSTTLAVEVPIWLDAAAIASLEVQYGVELFPKDGAARTLTGHIDFLQVRNGAVHILDYKPDARTNRPIAQLAIYALALTKLAALSLFDIKCAWFNEDEYCGFFPRLLFTKNSNER